MHVQLEIKDHVVRNDIARAPFVQPQQGLLPFELRPSTSFVPTLLPMRKMIVSQSPMYFFLCLFLDDELPQAGPAPTGNEQLCN